MSMGIYYQLDDAICAHIQGSHMRPIYATNLLLMARELIVLDLVSRRSPFLAVWRIIDRRMQAMRKTGRIEYVRGTGARPRWKVCEVLR